MAKVRILFTIPNFLTAGSGREMFNIIERLDKNLFEPYIAVQQKGGVLYDEILRKGYPIINEQFCVAENRSLLSKLTKAFLLAKKFKTYKFSIWQSFNWSSDYTEALVARFSGARYVYVKKNMNWNRLAWKVKSRLSSSIVARNTDLVNGPLAAKAFRSKTFFVPGGIPADFSVLPKSDIRTELSIPSGATMITCVAQLVEVKDQVTLIRAISEIDNSYLVLAGAERDIGYATSLRKLIETNKLGNRVFLLGSVSNVKELLQASDVFVLPTTNKGGHEEGCPVALLEAMAARVPCIASNVAGNRDLIKPKETGLLFSPENYLELAACIKYYMAHPRVARLFADNASREIGVRYTLENEARAFSNMYMGILKR